MLAAYDQAHRNGAGAAVFEGEMIDEANRKMAERIAFAGRAAGYDAMTRGTRIGLLAAAVVVLVVAFIALRPSSDDPETTADAPTATPTMTDTPTSEAELTEGETPTPTATPTPKPTVDPGPLLIGDATPCARPRGTRATPSASAFAPPQDDEVHVHGYDIKKDIKANQTASMSFKATIDGIFEIEFEEQGKQIAELRVDP